MWPADIVASIIILKRIKDVRGQLRDFCICIKKPNNVADTQLMGLELKFPVHMVHSS